MDILPTAYYLDFQKLFPDSEMVDVSPLIFSVRMIKSDYEISCIAKAAKIADDLFEKMPSFLEESETELDLTLRAESTIEAKGTRALSLPGASIGNQFTGTLCLGKGQLCRVVLLGPQGARVSAPSFLRVPAWKT